MTQLEAVRWLQSDGTPIACREKLRVLAENQAELSAVMRDTLVQMVAGLKTPRR